MPEIVYGRHAVYHLLRAKRRRVHKLTLLQGSEVVEDPLVALAKERRIAVESKGKSSFALWEHASHQGVIAEADPYPFLEIHPLLEKQLLLLCDSIQDPQNLGALCRSAYLLGVEGVVLLENRAVSISSSVCKAAAGAVEYLDIARVSSLANAINLMKQKEFWIYGADQEAEKSVYEERFPAKVAVVIGGEAKGLSRLVRERCDILLKVPMARGEIGSFNASTAGALLLAEIYRQKTFKAL